MNTDEIKKLILTESYNIMESPVNDLSKLQSMSDSNIKAAYLANILAALVLYRIGDRITKRLLRDPSGKTLARYSRTMSPLNFWGFVVHNSKSKQLKDFLSDETVHSLAVTTGRILRDHIKGIHLPISNAETSIDWDDMMDAVRVMTLRLPLRTGRINRIRDGIQNWQSLNHNERSLVISYTFYFLIENDSNSVLLTRLRAIANSSLLDANKRDDKVVKVVKYVGNKVTNAISAGTIAKIIKEDGESGGDVGGDAVGSDTTSSSDIAFVPFKLFKNKIVRKMKRSFTRLKSYEKKYRKAAKKQ